MRQGQPFVLARKDDGVLTRHGATAQAGETYRVGAARAGVTVPPAFGVRGKVDPAPLRRRLAQEQESAAARLESLRAELSDLSQADSVLAEQMASWQLDLETREATLADGEGRLEAAEDELPAPREALHVERAPALHPRDVGAGDERAPGAREDDASHVLARDRVVDGDAQLRDRVVVEGVQLVGAVDRDRGDPVGDVEGQVGEFFPAQAGSPAAPPAARAR